MKKNFLNLIFKILILPCFALHLQAFDVNYKSFGADFTQSVRSNDALIEYSGSFIITQNKAFWDYKKPVLKQLFISKNELIILEPELEQAMITSLDKVPNLSAIFKSAKKLSNTRYEATYEGVRYNISLENDEIKSISYKDELDNAVSITLFNVRRDFVVDESIFEAKIPKNYDILR